MEQTVVSVTEARTLLRMGNTRIYDLINDGTLQTVKLGSRRLVRIESIRRLLGEAA